MTISTIFRLPQVKSGTGLSRSTIYSLIQRGKFPAPISLSARAVGWLSTDIQQWIEQRAASQADKTGGEHA